MKMLDPIIRRLSGEIPFQYQEAAYMDEGANSKNKVPAWKNGALSLLFSPHLLPSRSASGSVALRYLTLFLSFSLSSFTTIK
jgi:hypothetical protein